MLYDPAAFELLTAEPWDEARARDGISQVVSRRLPREEDETAAAVA